MSALQPEAWLRGTRQEVHPLLRPVIFSFVAVREDLATHTKGISDDAVWRLVGGTSLGFHLRHIAGSVDRLTSYTMKEQLTPAQLDFLEKEASGGASLSTLLQEVAASLEASEKRLRQLNPDQIYDERVVGRRELPTTVIGLIVHLCEHTQRHLGQAITLAKVLRGSGHV